MKKIGILTYHCVPNFGAQLQALSTVRYFSNHGYEPVLLHWYPKDLEEFYYKRVSVEQNELQMRFAETYFPLSKFCRNLEELCEEIDRLNLDAIFLGSDALFDYTPLFFRYNISFKKLKLIPIFVTSNHCLPNPFWAGFNDLLVKPLPVIGFSISSQNMPYDKLNRKERKELGRLLGYFNGLTVRDKWTQELVEHLTSHKDIKITPDPVFAFNYNVDVIYTKEEICAKFNLPERYILISFIYPNLTDDYVNEIIQKIEEQTCIDCVSFPMPDRLRKFNTRYEINLPLSPIDWYYLIKYSDGYIGERMHPIIVCLHNSVPFFCFDQYGAEKVIIPRIWSIFQPKSSKIYDILERAGLVENMAFYADLNRVSPGYVVDKFIAFDQNRSKDFAASMMKKYQLEMKNLLDTLL